MQKTEIKNLQRKNVNRLNKRYVSFGLVWFEGKVNTCASPSSTLTFYFSMHIKYLDVSNSHA